MLILLSERFHQSVGWILPGEGKWLRPASGRCSPGCYRQGKGFNGNRNQPNYLSTMEHGKVEHWGGDPASDLLHRVGPG